MLFLCTSLFLLASASPNQFPYGEMETKFQLDGDLAAQGVGSAISPAGDVNADGFPDWMVGAHQASPGGVTSAGSLYIYSGKDNALLYQFDGTDSLDQLGAIISRVGDVNLDGFDDILFGSRFIGVGGTVFVYSGADGSLIHEIESLNAGEGFCSSVAGIDDVNNDGFPDFLVGASNASPGGFAFAGSAFIYSGKTGALLRQLDGAAAGDSFGGRCAAVGDLIGDGYTDFAISAAAADPNGLSSAGSVYIYSGKTNLLIYQYDGQTSGDYLGSGISSLGDLDADGFDDFILSASFATVGGVFAKGSAFLYSGATGALITQMNGTFGSQYFGGSVSGVGDVNDDGVVDFTISANNDNLTGLWNSGVAYLYSGATMSVIKKWQGTEAWEYFGGAVGMGDLDQDGYDEFLIGSPFADRGGLTDAGTVLRIGFNPFLTTTANTLSAGSTSLTGFELRFPIEAANYHYRVLFSAAGVGPFHFGINVPLTLDTFALDSYFGNYPFPYTTDLHGTLDANALGVAVIGAPPGFLSAAVGVTLNFAAIVNAPGHLPEFSSVPVAIEITP